MLCPPWSEMVNHSIIHISIIICLKGKFPIVFSFLFLKFLLQAGQGIWGRKESDVVVNIVDGLQNMEENIHQNKRKAKHYLGDIMADNLLWRKTGAVTAL